MTCTTISSPIAAKPVSRTMSFAPLAWALAMSDLYRQRRQLSQMDSHKLSDIGLTRAQALAEAKRPIWDAPSHWL